MNYKEIIIIVLLVAVIAILVKMMQVSKAQSEAISTLANRIPSGGGGGNYKRGLPSGNNYEQNSHRSGNSDVAEEDGEEGDGEDGEKQVKLKKVHKQILTLFNDGMPKTVIQLRQLFNEQFEKEMDNIKFTNTMWALKTKGVVLNEKVDGQNWWGPADWFENHPAEGQVFLEAYLQKIPEPTKKSKA